MESRPFGGTIRRSARGRGPCSARLESRRVVPSIDYMDPGFDEVYVHNVGRNREEFINAYGERVISKLRWPA
jgi:hypothetical protein